MTFKLRDYQEDAVQASISWLKKSTEPAILELGTGAGKSVINASVAHWFAEASGKKVLCLVPSAELCEQNAEKIGDASMMCAALNQKSVRHSIIVGTPATVKNNIKQMAKQNVGLVIIDECHETTPTIKAIIDTLREANPNLRVLGMTATPYRLGEGYIFSYWPDDRPVAEDEAVDPYYLKMLYQVTAEQLTERGYLTPMHADPDHIAGYDISGIKRHTERDPAFIAAFEQNRSKTLAIVDDFLPILRNRKGVMVFAATVQHAKEIRQLIPGSRVVTGDTPKEERAATVRDFKAQKFQYLINVGIYTRGFDATHIDAIVVMRSTDSAALFQQIIGRGLRLHDGKADCLLLDYADNIESHQLEDSLFKPQIKAKRKGNSIPVGVICPECSYTNEFSKRKNDDDLPMDDYGYLVDLAGNRVQTPDGKELPGHYGRRCFGFSLVAGSAQRCEYRWSVKVCDECGHENDVAARKCEKCKAELVSPEEKLQETFKRIKKDPAAQSTDKVISFNATHYVSNSGSHTVRCKFQTEYRTFEAYFMPDSTNNFIRAKYEMLSKAVFGKVAPDAATFAKYVHLGQQPQTVTYYKNKQSGFWEVTAFNKPEDKPEDFAA